MWKLWFQGNISAGIYLSELSASCTWQPRLIIDENDKKKMWVSVKDFFQQNEFSDEEEENDLFRESGEKENNRVKLKGAISVWARLTEVALNDATTLTIMTLIIITLSINTFSIKGLQVTLGLNDTKHKWHSV